MTSFIRKYLTIRKFRYLPKSLIHKETNRNRATRPPEYCRPYLPLSGTIKETIENLSEDINQEHGKLKRLLLFKYLNGDDDKNKTDLIKKREEEIKKLQDLRKRTIQHIYDQESVWKAMKERDELLRREEKDRDRGDKDKSDNDGETDEDTKKDPGKNLNVYRDTSLRYVGYLGHLGWICRSFTPFHLTNIASVSYVCADAFKATSVTAQRQGSERDVLKTGADVFLWHFLATFAIPGIFLHGVNSVTRSFQPPRSQCRPRSQFFLLPCVFSTLAIPLISKPIDHAVDDLMNTYFRKPYPKDDLKKEVKVDVKGDPVKSKSEVDQNKFNAKWFYDQSRDQNALEVERYYQKLKTEKDKQNNSSSNVRDDSYMESQQSNLVKEQNSETQSGLESKAVQVDKTTRPRKSPKAEDSES